MNELRTRPVAHPKVGWLISEYGPSPAISGREFAWDSREIIATFDPSPTLTSSTILVSA